MQLFPLSSIGAACNRNTQAAPTGLDGIISTSFYKQDAPTELDGICLLTAYQNS